MSRGMCWRLQAARGEWLLLVLLAAAYPASLVLPAAWSREGGPLEYLQVMVLVAGCVLALWVAPVWLLLAGRELSWGRAWLQQVGSEALAVTAPWLQALARPGAAVLLACLVVGAWYYRIDLPLRAALGRRVPWPCLAVALAAAMGSTCAEGHMSCHLKMAPSAAQLFEELCELLAYVALCLLQNVVLTHQRPLRLAPAIVHPVEEAG